MTHRCLSKTTTAPASDLLKCCSLQVLMPRVPIEAEVKHSLPIQLPDWRDKILHTQQVHWCLQWSPTQRSRSLLEVEAQQDEQTLLCVDY
ncbi:hypothetical protein R1flu_028970 [Riccia fluitans]|uniref:Uncharacterized protein n=1 Tax=Riccia fluitans TaxID=41844 RepID=A0ABD1XN77_9MARC